MKKCTYCGRENDSVLSHCGECGTELPATATPPTLRQSPEIVQSPSVQGPSSAEASGPAKTSGFAITSLVMGVLGIVGVTALVGLICGIVGLLRINRSNGRLKGRRLAIAGLCLSGLSLLFLPVLLAALLLPARAKAKARAERVVCLTNLKQLAEAVRRHASDNNGRYPSGGNWCDAITQYVPQPTVFHCPAAADTARCTYALNAKLSGMEASKIRPNTVMLFEIEDGWNMSGTLEQMLKRNPHGPRGATVAIYTVALADGSVRWVLTSELSELRWEP